MWPFKETPRIEDPERLARFLRTLEKADWAAHRAAALESVFTALNELVHHEILFYYRARKKQRFFSQFTRGAALALGSVGVMLPLLAGADPELFKPYQPYGYPFLVAAATFVAVNRMFGATGGHIRYVTAQLALERTLTKFRLEWLEKVAAGEPDRPETAAKAFSLMHAFVDEAYRIIQEETTVWGTGISQALDDYEAKLSLQTKAR